MTMRGAAVRMRLGLSLLCGAVLGCVSPPPAGPFHPDPPNPFLEALFKSEVLVIMEDGKPVKLNPPLLKPDVVLREIPLRTPVAEARAVMERHGFSCQGGVRENFQTCLYCKAYKRTSAVLADRVVVKLFYEDQRVVNVAVTIEKGVKRGDTFWPEF
jgi:hypothetical protein